MPQWSLILATIGRDAPLAAFLQSLDAQGPTDCQLIVVDQNRDDRVSRVLEHSASGRAARRLQSPPGLSRARNLALPYARGEILGFPDDDCEYPPGLMARVADFFSRGSEYDGLLVRVASREGRGVLRYDRRAGAVTRVNAWTRSNSSGMFLRRRVIHQVGGFDEAVGTGSGTPWAGGNDIDYVLRVLAFGYRVYYDPQTVVWHPVAEGYAGLAGRALSYGTGQGYLWRKHRLPWWFALYYVTRSVGGIGIALAKGDGARARFHLAALRGRLRGWLVWRGGSVRL